MGFVNAGGFVRYMDGEGIHVRELCGKCVLLKSKKEFENEQDR